MALATSTILIVSRWTILDRDPSLALPEHAMLAPELEKLFARHTDLSRIS